MRKMTSIGTLGAVDYQDSEAEAADRYGEGIDSQRSARP
jgi:hypothetical protein